LFIDRTPHSKNRNLNTYRTAIFTEINVQFLLGVYFNADAPVCGIKCFVLQNEQSGFDVITETVTDIFYSQVQSPKWIFF
jgi:hypothetical protein